MMKTTTMSTFCVIVLLLVCQVTVIIGEIRENLFERFHLCSDILPTTETVLTHSKLTCAALCAAETSCTACSYVTNGTCNLHYNNLTSHTCQTATTPSVHFRKLQLNVTSSQVCYHGGTPVQNDTSCQCYGGYIGDHCERLMTDCTEGVESGHYPAMSGLYQAQPTSATTPIQIHCNNAVHTNVLMRWRADVAFNVTMADYVNGIGGKDTDYWIGLEKLHLITSNAHNYILGVQVSNWSSNPFYQHYYVGFKVKSAAEGYTMTFTSHYPAQATPMGDCLTPLMNISFSTYDDDNDGNPNRNCAADYGGGWWYNVNCSQCNLMGTLRLTQQTREPGAVDEVFWQPGLEPEDFSPAVVYVFLFR